MKYILFLLFLVFNFYSHAQHITQKTFSKEAISSISIHGEYVFKITVDAKPVSEITVRSRVEGENNENIVLITEAKNNHLYIAVKQQPLFVDANDKLSAHKVISVEINVVIPGHLSMGIDLYESDLIVKGAYDKVRVHSDTGNCIFTAFQGSARIDTRNGNVAMQTNHAKVSAASKNGYIKKEEIDAGNQEVLIKTINGNVTITKSQ